DDARLAEHRHAAAGAKGQAEEAAPGRTRETTRASEIQAEVVMRRRVVPHRVTSRVLLLVALAAALASSALAQQNHIDSVTPAAPELAAYGNYDIGVRTLQVTDKDRPDILSTKEGGPVARYDR